MPLHSERDAVKDKIRKSYFGLLITLLIFLSSGCATLSGSDPGARTPGTIIDDVAIQNLAMRQIRQSDERFRSANLTIASYNGHVLLAGQVSSADLKEKAQDIINRLEHVQSVHNELTVEGSTALLARTNDAWLTSKVKAKLVTDRAVSADRIKVVTENGVVYLMGIVPRAQADEAVRVVSTVGGVQKIVKVFDYLD
jgi:osmotically-inducible protein OsmY